MKLEPIIVSLLDTDLYKFNMDQVIFHKHTDLCGQYYFKCRNENIVFTPEMEDEINAQIDHLCSLHFTKEELDYLRSIRFIKDDYVEFLRLWRPIRDYVTVSRSDSGELQIVVDGPLFSAMQFEIFLLDTRPCAALPKKSSTPRSRRSTAAHTPSVLPNSAAAAVSPASGRMWWCAVWHRRPTSASAPPMSIWR